MDPREDAPVVQLPVVDRDDINQEAALLELQGIKPSRRLLALRMRERELTFSGDIDCQPLPTLAPGLPDPEVIEALIDWTLDQVDEVQAQMFEFLEDPEERFEETAEFLLRIHLIQPLATPAKAASNADLFRNALPAAKEDLYTLARLHLTTTRRPEATVRQWLRRSLEAGLVEVDGDLIRLRSS